MKTIHQTMFFGGFFLFFNWSNTCTTKAGKSNFNTTSTQTKTIVYSPEEKLESLFHKFFASH